MAFELIQQSASPVNIQGKQQREDVGGGMLQEGMHRAGVIFQATITGCLISLDEGLVANG
jgi:hypothetical protein